MPREDAGGGRPQWGFVGDGRTQLFPLPEPLPSGPSCGLGCESISYQHLLTVATLGGLQVVENTFSSQFTRQTGVKDKLG